MVAVWFREGDYRLGDSRHLVSHGWSLFEQLLHGRTSNYPLYHPSLELSYGYRRQLGA